MKVKVTEFNHITVLRDEAASLLAPAEGTRVVDGTLGGGGHSEALLARGAHVVGLDQDPVALQAARARLSGFGDRFVSLQGNFRNVRSLLDSIGVQQVDGALVDLGVSSPQLDVAERGFSFSRPGPLDMRMDPTSGVPLSEWLKTTSEEELTRVLFEYGEEPSARRISKAIIRAVEANELENTAELARVVSEAIPRAMWPKAIHSATRTFQALRIAVNDELGALEAWLDALPSIIAVGGRACAISFHSLEDRPVKQRFVELAKGCICPPDLPVCACGRTPKWRLVTRKPISASDEEIERNPRARSAHLRCIERIAA